MQPAANSESYQRGLVRMITYLAVEVSTTEIRRLGVSCSKNDVHQKIDYYPVVMLREALEMPEIEQLRAWQSQIIIAVMCVCVCVCVSVVIFIFPITVLTCKCGGVWGVNFKLRCTAIIVSLHA